mgnify:CR=1 FL=1
MNDYSSLMDERLEISRAIGQLKLKVRMGVGDIRVNTRIAELTDELRLLDNFISDKFPENGMSL